MNIFVYGTLKRGFCRHFAIESETFLGEARTAPRYRMFNVGTYPALIETDSGISIQGEVWSVNDIALARLDEVEGVDESLYIRKPIQLIDTDLMPVEAYFYLRSTEGCPDCGDIWL
ncbi:gamma-glutamylcyclotransferase family protein [Planctomicrobium sp. SH661]|uniref:gamma-glutamylcyclotransferase family protein n=1 Tax=Planctomicrobium sp. SH661 TaxID=3448124 RepID=UPI003F5C89B3